MLKTSTLLVLLGVSIIAVSIITFSSFVLTYGITGSYTAYLAPAGAVFSVAILMGFGQILIGRALRPASPEAESEMPAKASRQKMIPAPKMRAKPQKEEPRVIAVEDEEPSAWLKNTLDKLADQGNESPEENVTPAEMSFEEPAPSKPKLSERTVPHPVAKPVQPQRQPIPIPPRREPAPEPKAKPAPVTAEEEEPSPFVMPEFGGEADARPETQETKEPEGREPEPSETEEAKPGGRKMQDMEITFVERDGITFLESGTGIHERYPCTDQALIDYAWRALVRGIRVSVEVKDGKVTKITPSS